MADESTEQSEQSRQQQQAQQAQQQQQAQQMPRPQYKGEAPSYTQEELDEKLAAREGTSSQAQYSTYSEVEPPETNPPSGRMVEQELGEPSEGPVKKFGE